MNRIPTTLLAILSRYKILNYQQTLEQLKQKAPCSVYFEKNLCWDGSGMALVSYDITTIGTKPTKIVVDNTQYSLCEQIISLHHELAHCECIRKNCKCISNKVLLEYHAFKQTLQWTWKTKDKQLIKAAVGLVKWNYTNAKDEHFEAAKKVMKLRLWRKALKFIGVQNEKGD